MKNSVSLILTDKAQCRDCNRCVRVCPVKAIRMHKGQAYVVEQRCVACGTCIRECPQHAKSFRVDLTQAKDLISTESKVAVSIAPSFAGLFSKNERDRLATALRRLGFKHVSETAIGASYVTRESMQIASQAKDKLHISSACPAVVRFTELYHPKLIPSLIPVVSPMIAHARFIRSMMGEETKVIFIGPCVAKKAEAEREEYRSEIDCVLTFAELSQWFQDESIIIEQCEIGAFDVAADSRARTFALEGGFLHTAKLGESISAKSVISLSGFDMLNRLYEDLNIDSSPLIVEPLFCAGGCLNGPALERPTNCYSSRKELLSYCDSENCGFSAEPSESDFSNHVDMSGPSYKDCTLLLHKPNHSEDAIAEVLAATGKAEPSDQFNCGACGYETCRDKAIAVLEDMAEPEMCFPHMRRLAEQRTDRIIETSPNGILVLDKYLCILHMNPAFQKYFLCSPAIYGKHISHLMDPKPFEDLGEQTSEAREMQQVVHERYNLICHQILYRLEAEQQYVGIFVNITNTQKQKHELRDLKVNTVLQARELIEHQIQMAETIARCLGESTARSENLLAKLGELANDPSDDK